MIYKIFILISCVMLLTGCGNIEITKTKTGYEKRENGEIKEIGYSNDDFNIICYTERDREVLEPIAMTLNKSLQRINEKLHNNKTLKTTIKVFPDLASMHMESRGILGLLFGPEWWIGDNMGETVVLVSPLNPGKKHSYQSIINASVHEYIHTINFQINPKMDKWLNEGIAVYFTKGADYSYISFSEVPKYDDFISEDPILFGNCGGYQYSPLYIDYIIKTYGFEKMMEVMKQSPLGYQNVLGKKREEIYLEWKDYLYKLKSNV